MRILMLGVIVLAAAAADAAACSKDILKVEKWTIKPVDKETNELSYTLRSAAQKPIRMVDGGIKFSDALGGRIGSMAIERDVAIPVGGEFSHSAMWGPHTFERLLKLKAEEVQTETCVKAVLYEDGSKETFN